MNNRASYFHLSTLTKNPCFQTKPAHAAALGTTLCAGCLHPRPDITAIDVWLQGQSPRDKPLNFLYACGLGLIHQELVDLLEPIHVERDLYLGRVYNASSRECTDWHTFHGRRTLIMRGSEDAEYRTCPECGRNIYHATGTRYLFPSPPADAEIYGSNLGGLIVPSETAARIKAKRWRVVHVEPLPVVESPADGFGPLPYRNQVTEFDR